MIPAQNLEMYLIFEKNKICKIKSTDIKNIREYSAYRWALDALLDYIGKHINSDLGMTLDSFRKKMEFFEMEAKSEKLKDAYLTAEDLADYIIDVAYGPRSKIF